MLKGLRIGSSVRVFKSASFSTCMPTFVASIDVRDNYTWQTNRFQLRDKRISIFDPRKARFINSSLPGMCKITLKSCYTSPTNCTKQNTSRASFSKYTNSFPRGKHRITSCKLLWTVISNVHAKLTWLPLRFAAVAFLQNLTGPLGLCKIWELSINYFSFVIDSCHYKMSFAKLWSINQYDERAL